MILNYNQTDNYSILPQNILHKIVPRLLFYCSVLFKLLKFVIVLLLYQVYTNVRVNKVQTSLF